MFGNSQFLTYELSLDQVNKNVQYKLVFFFLIKEISLGPMIIPIRNRESLNIINSMSILS